MATGHPKIEGGSFVFDTTFGEAKIEIDEDSLPDDWAELSHEEQLYVATEELESSLRDFRRGQVA